MNFDELDKLLTNIRLDNTNSKTNYIENYEKLISNDRVVVDTAKVIDVFNESINECIQKDNIFHEQLNKVQKSLQTLNTKFLYKNSLCKEYITKYNDNKISTINVLELYNNNIINVCIKNNEYNKMIQELLDQYNQKFEEYLKDVSELYPKSFMVQIVVNMIILTDMRNRSNILFKNMLLDEILKQKNELNNTTELLKNNELNRLIMNECVDIDALISKMDGRTDLKIKEEDIENMINQL